MATTTSRHVTVRSASHASIVSGLAVLIQLASVTPAHAQASPDCFKVCSNLFYKHVNALMKCAYKGRADEAVTTACATKAVTKMEEKYVAKPQGKCADASCLTAYPSTNDVGCETVVLSTGTDARTFFGNAAVPSDPVMASRITTAGVVGCGY
jgi:hypothetical protein